MIDYFGMGNKVKLGQVAYAQPYPPGGLEWGQGWGRFAPSTPKVVLPHSGGGVGYTSQGAVLSKQDVEEVTAAALSPVGAANPAASSNVASASSQGKFPVAATGVALAVILAAIVV